MPYASFLRGKGVCILKKACYTFAVCNSIMKIRKFSYQNRILIEKKEKVIMNKIIWKDNEDIVAGTTLRDAQAKEDNNMALHVGGNLTDVIANRQRLSEDLGISLNQWVFTQQTHSDHMHEVTKADAGKGSLLYVDGIADCDALYTKESHIALGVFHADCVPVLLYDPFTHLIAAIHSGWQGTVKEIMTVADILALL